MHYFNGSKGNFCFKHLTPNFAEKVYCIQHLNNPDINCIYSCQVELVRLSREMDFMLHLLVMKSKYRLGKTQNPIPLLGLNGNSLNKGL